MTMTRWFRQHQRYMIAGLVILLMASWGVLSTVRSLVGTPTKKETIAGRTVQQADLEDGQQALTMMLRLGLLSGQTPYYMTQLHAPIRATVKMRTPRLRLRQLRIRRPGGAAAVERHPRGRLALPCAPL